MPIARALLALTLILLTACNESSFTGSSVSKPPQPARVPKPMAQPATPAKADAAKEPAAVAPQADDAAPQIGSGSASSSGSAAGEVAAAEPPAPADVVVPPGCGADGATQARLLTPELDVTAVDAHLEYEVYRTDCDGVIQAFVADKILFDIDAWGAYSDMTATLTQDGAAPVPTTLKLTIGSDLFGHTGAGWAHQETTEKVELHGAAKSVRLRIELAGRSLAPREAPAGGPAADGSVPIPTFLRFGNAVPIKVDVKALHPGTAPSGGQG